MTDVTRDVPRRPESAWTCPGLYGGVWARLPEPLVVIDETPPYRRSMYMGLDALMPAVMAPGFLIRSCT